jgi:hypothetical protein
VICGTSQSSERSPFYSVLEFNVLDLSRFVISYVHYGKTEDPAKRENTGLSKDSIEHLEVVLNTQAFKDLLCLDKKLLCLVQAAHIF